MIGLLNQDQIQSVIAHAEELVHTAEPRRPIPIPWRVYERRVYWAHSVVSKIFPDKISDGGAFLDRSIARVRLLETLLTCLEERPAGYDSCIPVDHP